MTTIYCFSGSGHSYAVAQALSEMGGWEIRDIAFENNHDSQAEIAVVVFPVYCQNIPEPVKLFLKKLIANYIVLIATYGKISYGNVLYEAKKLVRGEIIAGAYIPIGHTFLNGDYSFHTEFLMPIVKRINSPKKASISKTHKNPLADIFPDFRSRICVDIVKNDHCRSCGVCENKCPVGAISKGKIGRKCIRCMRCVTNCPENALQYKNSRILDKYLHSYYKEEYLLYL